MERGIFSKLPRASLFFCLTPAARLLAIAVIIKLFAFAVIAGAQPVFATAFNDAADGDWQNSSTWSPTGVPGNGDSVTVDSHTVTLTDNRTIDAVTISGGTLYAGASRSWISL